MLNPQPQRIVGLNPPWQFKKLWLPCQDQHHPRDNWQVIDHLTETLINIGKCNCSIPWATRGSVPAKWHILHVIYRNEEARITLPTYKPGECMKHVAGIV